MRKLALNLVPALLLVSCGGGGTGPAYVQSVPAAPAFTTQPSAQAAVLGQPATFSAQVSGYPAPTFQWFRNGTAITGATASTYQTPATAKTDQNAVFVLNATNASGTTVSSGAALTVEWAPTITTQPADTIAVVGSKATFVVAADGYPVPTCQWLLNEQAIAGATADTYTTPATTLPQSGGSYLAVLTNAVGGVTSSPAILTVAPVPTAVAITSQPAAATAVVGQSVTFTVAATGTAPLTYQWSLGGTAIPGATAATYTIPSVALTDAGNYTVAVDNLAASPQTSTPALLTVNPVPVAPTLATQPSNLTVTEGNPASFTVTANGTAPLAYQWLRDQAAITGATGATYVLPAAALADSGAQFLCSVSNPQGTVASAAATLTVVPATSAPIILGFTATPASIILGQTSTLGWTVTGARSLALDNGVGDVTGTVAKIVTPTTLGPVAYDLTATNALGTATRTATVTVASGPTYDLAVSVGTGVAGLPAAGTLPFVSGSIVTYGYTLATGYMDLQVTMDGAAVNPSGTLVMNAAHTLAATAQPQTLLIAPTAGAGGTISPATAQMVAYGQSATFTFTPAAGYLVATVLVDGVSVGASGTYTFTNVTTAHQISVTFVQGCLLTVNLGPGVTGTPAATQTFPAGTLAYSYTALTGYATPVVTEDGTTTLPATGTLTLAGPHTLTVTAQPNLIPITCLITGSGTIQPAATNGVVNITYGQIPIFTFVPASGYVLGQALVDNVQVTVDASGSYTFPGPVTAPHVIQAVFVPQS